MRVRARSDTFFTPEERESLKALTREVESRTIGEVVVMVVDRSDRYPDAEVIGGVLLASLVSLVVTLLFFHSSLWSFIPLGFLCFFPCRHLFAKAEVLKRPLIGIGRKEEAVRLRAERAFIEKGLDKTKRRTGVLFFLSLLERKIWVLADQGIYEKMDQETLERFAADVSKGIREGRAFESLSRAIREVGTLLARHFPISPDDTNELTDEVITGK